MAAVGTVLLWVLWALLGLIGLALALLLLALLLPARVGVSWSPAGLQVWAGVPGIRLQLAPAKPGKRSKKKKPAAKPQKAERAGPQEKPAADSTAEKTADRAAEGAAKKTPEQPAARPTGPKAAAAPAAPKKPPVEVPALLESLPLLVNMAGEFLGRVLHSLRFKQLRIIVPVTGGEPDAVARNVGRANAWFYAIASSLEPRLRLRWQDVAIFPDYDGARQEELLLQATVCGQLLPVAIAALWLLAALKKEKII